MAILGQGFDSGVELGLDAGFACNGGDHFFGVGVVGFFDTGDQGFVDLFFSAEPFCKESIEDDSEGSAGSGDDFPDEGARGLDGDRFEVVTFRQAGLDVFDGF